MTSIIKICLFSLACLVAGNSYAETAAPTPNQLDIVQQEITAYMAKNAIPGVAVELFVDGKPKSYYFGYADLAKKKPITQKTIFEVGSIAKIMTSLLLAEKVDLADMQFNAPVKKYLPNLGTDFNTITLLNLATHTSGLPFKLPETVKTHEQVESYLANWQPPSAPGEQYLYSNAGIGLLGYALESVTHKSINELYVRYVLLPLKMQPIGFTVPKRLLAFYAQGYDKEGKPISSSSQDIFPAAYDIKASSGDMQRFLSAAIGLPGTPEAIFYPMRMTQASFVDLPEMSQGLAWQIHSLAPVNLTELLNEAGYVNKGPIAVADISVKPVFDGKALIDKTGATAGFRAYIAVIPSKKTGIVILANKATPNTEMVKIGRDILFKLNGIVPVAASTQQHSD